MEKGDKGNHKPRMILLTFKPEFPRRTGVEVVRLDRGESGCAQEENDTISDWLWVLVILFVLFISGHTLL